MRAERPPSTSTLGDTIYSDTEVEAPPDRSFPRRPDGRPEWGRVQAEPRQPLSARPAARRASYSHWDDHEFINDFSPREDTFENVISGITESVSGPVLYRRARSRRSPTTRRSPTAALAGSTARRAGAQPRAVLRSTRRSATPRPTRTASATTRRQVRQRGAQRRSRTAPCSGRCCRRRACHSPLSQQCLDTIRDPTATTSATPSSPASRRPSRGRRHASR